MCAKENPNVPMDEDSASESLDGVVDVYKRFCDVLGCAYVDVIERLNLNFVPRCVFKADFCEENHSKKSQVPPIIDRDQCLHTKQFAIHNSPLNFLKSVEDMCVRLEFPNESIMHSIIEIILNNASENSCSSSYLLRECILVFEHMIKEFPPCWYKTHTSYRNFFTDPIDITVFLPDKHKETQTIYKFVLGMIEQTILEEDKEEASVSATTYSSDSDDFDFNEWERRNCPKNSFSRHSRSEKIDRLFIVLHLITKILEYDLSIWMLRHLKRPNKNMANDKKPLIAHIFFDDTYNQMTPIVKDTIKVFTMCAAHSYPSEQMNILARIITILSVSVNLCQRTPVEEQIYFPYFGNKIEAFVKEIYNSGTNVFGANLQDHIKVIKNLKNPAIKYVMIFHLLYKMNNDHGQITLRKFVEDFAKARWISECDPEPENESKCYQRTETKYPVIHIKSIKKCKASSIHRLQYLDILFDAFKAYCEAHYIAQIAKIFQNYPKGSVSIVPNPTTNRLDVDIPLDLRKIKNDIKLLEENFLASNPKIEAISSVQHFNQIYVDENVVLKYREDIKFLLILQKQILEQSMSYPNELAIWRSYIDSILC